MRTRTYQSRTMSFKFGIIVSVLHWCVVTIAGRDLHCYECVDAYSNKHCLRIGKIVKCHRNQDACMTVVRRMRTGYKAIRITKRCKQGLACENYYRQNVGGLPGVFRAATERQCAGEGGPPTPSAACRCCCAGNLCNYGFMEACNGAFLRRPKMPQNEPTCPSIEGLFLNGKATCSRDHLPTSRCHFKCDRFYDLYGSTDVTCVKKDFAKAEWSNRPPCCALPCPPYGSMDLIFAMQHTVASSTIWEAIKSFTMSILRPFVEADRLGTRVGFFTFGKKPDAVSQFMLNSDIKPSNLLYRRVRNLKRRTYGNFLCGRICTRPEPDCSFRPKGAVQQSVRQNHLSARRRS
ncbi:unnamed protein product [Clavelina lepadiformis]|uniref:Sushi domain-containing protein n=1 Tax=Clavelina lepadiformis TaxID=159417 RepID=A0ABP0EW48_CLALP